MIMVKLKLSNDLLETRRFNVDSMKISISALNLANKFSGNLFI